MLMQKTPVSMVVSHSCKWLFLSCSDGSIYRVQLRENYSKAVICEYKGQATALAVSPDDQHIALAINHKLMFYSIPENYFIFEKNYTNALGVIKYSMNRALVGATDNTLHIVVPEIHKYSLPLHRANLHSISVGTDLVITASDDKTIKILNNVSFTCLKTIKVKAKVLGETMITKNDEFIAAKVDNTQIWVWNT